MNFQGNGYPNNMGYGVPTNQVRNNVTFDTNCNFINVDSPNQVREFIVNPGQTRYFMDNNNPYMYVKSAEVTGITTTKACRLEEVNFDTLVNPPAQVQSGVSKEDFDNLFGVINSLAARVDALEVPSTIKEQPKVNNNNNNKKNNFRRDRNE